MNTMLVIAGIAAGLLFVYLLVALFDAEDF